MTNDAAALDTRGWIRRAWARVTAGGWLLLGVTVVLPGLALLVEWATGMCAATFFDPLPTGWHMAAVATVPAANLAVWLCARYAPPDLRRAAGLLVGLALGLSTWFALCFLPLALLGTLVLVGAWWYFGLGLLGLLPMAPVLALFGGLALRRRLCRAYGVAARARVPGARGGFLLGVLAVLLLLASDVLTLSGLHLAASADGRVQARGLELLRRAGRRDLMLKACEWHRNSPFKGLMGMLLPDADRLTQERARIIFYRATGEDYRLHLERGWSPVRGWRGRGGAEASLTWDREQGGERVGGILKGLSLHGSRFEERLVPAAGLAYAEWTLVFRNEYNSPREARARIALPPGSVVSRLTLWIDGEEREAAFGGRSQTRQAYERIVRQQRDPVLVASCGPDRIQVQCFPVPADGGEMKLRLGLTVPLRVAPDGRSATLPAPAILARNFQLPTDTLDLPATRTLDLDPPLVPGAVWCREERTGRPATVHQAASRNPAWRPRRMALVVDGSGVMAARLPAIADALRALPAGIEARVWFVDDGPGPGQPFVVRAPLDDAAWASLADLLSARRCQGGRCNLRTLQAAWDDLANEAGEGALVWLHGPQPYPAASTDDLQRRFERAPRSLRVFMAQVAPGTCAVSEGLDGGAAAATLAPAESLRDAGCPLRELFDAWQPGATVWQFLRMHTEGTQSPDGAVETGDHLARIWAVEEVRRLLVTGDPVRRGAAQQLALAWNLVTPVSSAVVLESQRQYQDAGLEAVSADSVPTVPEPGFWVSLAAAAAALVWILMRRRAAATRA